MCHSGKKNKERFRLRFFQLQSFVQEPLSLCSETIQEEVKNL